MHGGVAMAAGHLALMFGGTGSVHGWDKPGVLLRHLARKLLHMPASRYVDDYFGVEVEGTEEHAMNCFARLVRALLGPTAVKEEKLDSGRKLEVLGLEMSYDDAGVVVKVTETKAQKWAAVIEMAVQKKVLHSGDAAKMAGRLSFASQKTFKRAGRAALRPIFRQQYAPLKNGRVGEELEMALEWWLHALRTHMAQRIEWCDKKETVTLLTDARGSPPRVSAVLIVNGQFYYTDMEPSRELMAVFQQRKDNQIMGLELLGIALGLCTFASMLSGRSVRAYCDNVGGEHAMAAGAARSKDHNRMIHSMWMLALQLDIALWVDRVPTKENIADLPSRESYELLENLGATWVEPLLNNAFYHPERALAQLAGS
jgi:hypothetical protein